MKTSDHLAAAATQLAILLRHGQDDLTTEPDLILAARARDHAAAGLAQALRTVVARLDVLGGHQDAVRATTMTIAELTARTSTLPDPAHHPTPLPAARSAQAWVQAAAEMDAATLQIRRAGDAAGPDLRAAAADLTALAGTLACLDADLARALTAGGLDHAAKALTGADQASPERLQHHSRTATSILAATDLPEQYHLPPPALGVVPVPTARLLPAAVRRATALVDQSPPLTATQHAAVAIQTARLAHHLRRHLAADPTLADSLPVADAALRRFTHAQLGLAHVWSTTTSLWCSGPGSWDAPAQLQAINRFLAEQPGLAFTPGRVRETVSLLPQLAAAVARGFDQALAREEWLAAYHDGTGQTAWATLWPDYGPSARGLTPAVSDVTPVDVHVAGHAVHETWHDRGIPVEGYRLGDPIEDRRVGSPGGVAELTRIYVATDAVTATGRGLHTAVGPPPATPPDAVTARRILPTHPAPMRQVPSAQVLAIRHAGDLPEGLHRVAALLHTADRLSPTQLRLITRATAETALVTAQALDRAGHHVSADALTEHARLLTNAVRHASAAAPTTRGGPHPLAQAQQIRDRLAALRRTGVPLNPAQALAVAQIIPVVTEALTETTHRMISSSSRHDTPAVTAPGAVRRRAKPADVLDRLTAAAIHGTQLRTALSTDPAVPDTRHVVARAQPHPASSQLVTSPADDSRAAPSPRRSRAH